MAGDDFEFEVLNEDLRNLKIEPSPPPPLPSSSRQQQDPAAAAAAAAGGLEINCFTDIVDNVTLHFQIIRLPKQIYAWVGCNSAKFGHLYAAASTRPNNGVSVTSLLGGGSDNTGSGIARRIVLKTGLSVVLACNLPKNSPTLEANAEKKLIEKLIHLGYTRPKSEGFPS